MTSRDIRMLSAQDLAALDDEALLGHINGLVDEENRLRAQTQAPEQNVDNIRHVREAIDQCWDLLRQRRAKREFGADPKEAQVRDVQTVEGYIN